MLKSTILNILSPILPSSRGKIAKLVEIFRGTNSLNILKDYNKTDKINRDELNNLKIEKLNKLIISVLNNNVYYTEHLRKTKREFVPLKSIDDFKSYNILTKSKLRKGIRNNIYHKNLKKMKYEIAASGGTTGDPVIIFMDRNARSHGSAALLRYYDWWDVKIGDKMALLWGRQANPNHSKLYILKTELHKLLGNRLYLNSFVLNNEILENHYKEIFNYNPIILRGYANSLYLFAVYVNNNKLPLWTNLKVISSTSEKLTKEKKVFIETVFNKPVTDQYGCGEIYGAAFECPEGRNIHISEEHVHIECLNEVDEPVFEKEGRIVITDLDNYVTPLIRYEVGDLGIITKKQCICNRSHLVLKEITGRLSNELIMGNNNKISQGFWPDIFKKHSEISEATVYVISPEKLIIDFLLHKDFSKNNLTHLKISINEVVGKGIEIEFRKVKKIIKSNSGKHNWVIKNPNPIIFNSENIIEIL